MRKKTKILLAMEIIFLISMIVIAFGSFIENQNNSEILPETGHMVQTDLKRTEKISLEKNQETMLEFKAQTE